MHSLRMAGQGIKTTSLLGGIIALAWLLFRASGKIQLTDFYYWFMVGFAHVKLSIGEIFYNRQEIIITSYDFILQQNRTMPALEFIQRIWQAPIGHRIMDFQGWLLNHSIFEAIAAFSLSLGISSIFFIIRGKKNMQKTKIRGGDFVLKEELARSLYKQKLASDITIAGLPLVKNSENMHMVITGITGSGKTNLLHELLVQIRKRGDKAIIVDVNGSLLSAYYSENDKILNPYDQRSKLWLPWADCKQDYDFDALAKTLGAESHKSDPYWDNSARKIIATALKEYKHDPDIKKLLHILNTASSLEYSNFFADTNVASLTQIGASGGDKTAMSIRSNIGEKIYSLSLLQQTNNPFSITDYILNEDDNSWLFMTSMPDQRQALSPLITSWMDIALHALMKRPPTNENSKIWIIIDELPAIGYIPSLKTALAESRKYGGCIVAGMQNIHQLKTIYQHNEALALLDQFNSRFIFRVGDDDTANINSRMLGIRESKENMESLSYGANTIRDGVNINTIERQTPLVLPTEITLLKSLECYVKLAGSWPITKLSMDYNKRKTIAPWFVPKTPNGEAP